jgi:hypothetical protein
MEHVEGRALRAVFSTIQGDEARHAALAFQFARWTMQTFGSEARRSVEQAFDSAIARLDATVTDGLSEPELFAHGQLNPADRHLTSLKALAEVIAPARLELLHGCV